MHSSTSSLARISRLPLPSRKTLLQELNRAQASTLAGRPVVLGPALIRTLTPLATAPSSLHSSSSSTSSSTASFSTALTHPRAVHASDALLASVGKRNFSVAMRLAGYLTRRADPEVLRNLEKAANREPGNVTAQVFYLQALHK
jgi:hypothetical protein